jgi:hypothetical protein
MALGVGAQADAGPGTCTSDGTRQARDVPLEGVEVQQEGGGVHSIQGHANFGWGTRRHQFLLSGTP